MSAENYRLYEPQNGFDRLSTEEEAAVNRYCEGYKDFLNRSKTERLFIENSIALARENGFVPLAKNMPLRAGDRVYSTSRGRNAFLAVIGEQRLQHQHCPCGQPAFGHQAAPGI